MSEKKSLSIRVIAPSFKIPKADLKQCLQNLKDLKIKALINQPLFNEKELCSNTLDKRFDDLKDALKEFNDYIWCLRGGYGCLHFMPRLLKMKKPAKAKKLIGFSDITVLHYYFNQKWNWPSLHWKHINGFLKEVPRGSQDPNAQAPVEKEFDIKAFKKALSDFETQDEFIFKNLKPLNEAAKKVKTLKAKVVGGNLITLQSLVGLNIPKPKGKFLFLEEVDEPIYKIDRALVQLEQNEWFKGVKGILIGSFSHKNKNVEKDTQKYFIKKAQELKIPVFTGLNAGHIPDQQPLFLNTDSTLVVENQKYNLKIKNGFKGA